MPVPAGSNDIPLILPTDIGAAVDDAEALRAIAFATAWVESKTGYAFSLRTATITLPATADFELAIPLKPLRNITAVSVGGVAVTGYELTADNTLYYGHGWGGGWVPGKALVTLEYGFDVAPDGIKGVVTEVALGIYDGRLGISNERLDDYAVTYSGVLSQTSKDVLAGYGCSVAMVRVAG